MRNVCGPWFSVRGPPAPGSISNRTPLPLGEKRSGTKLEKTSLSTGGFLRVPYGYRSWPRLRYQRAGNPFHPSESPAIRLSGIDGQEYPLTELQIISIIALYILFYNDSMNI